MTIPSPVSSKRHSRNRHIHKWHTGTRSSYLPLLHYSNVTYWFLKFVSFWYQDIQPTISLLKAWLDFVYQIIHEQSRNAN